MDLIIEGSPAELEWLRREIEREVGAEAQLEAVTEQGENLSEPFLIALIVALGGPAVTKAVKDIVKRRYEHKEAIATIEAGLEEVRIENSHEIAKLRLFIESDGSNKREIAEQELEGLA